MASRRAPQELAGQAAAIGATVKPAPLDEAVAADVVILAVPFSQYREVAKAAATWDGRLVIDATNAFGTPLAEFGGLTSSAVVAQAFPGARFVKGFNHLPAAKLAADPSVNGGRRVIFTSSDDADAQAKANVLDRGARLRPGGARPARTRRRARAGAGKPLGAACFPGSRQVRLSPTNTLRRNRMMKIDLTGRKGIVTGSTAGIGLATAEWGSRGPGRASSSMAAPRRAWTRPCAASAKPCRRPTCPGVATDMATADGVAALVAAAPVCRHPRQQCRNRAHPRLSRRRGHRGHSRRGLGPPFPAQRDERRACDPPLPAAHGRERLGPRGVRFQRVRGQYPQGDARLRHQQDRATRRFARAG